MRSKLFILCSLVLVFLIKAPLVQGDINGDFSDGLTGWTTADNISTIPSISVYVDSEQAVLATQGIALGTTFISLYQSFDIPSWAGTLSFDIGFWRLGSDDIGSGSSGSPDYLGASYVDKDAGNYDKDLIGYDNNGLYVGNPLGSVIGLSGGWYRFTIPITDLANRSGTLYFDLSDYDDGYFSIAKVDNVINSTDAGNQGGKAPEPITLILFGVGFAGAGLYRRMRRPN